MKVWFSLLISLLFCCVAIADDAVLDLSKHLEKTPALVVVVCGSGEADLPIISGLVEQTPWTVFCRGKTTAGSEIGQESRDSWAIECMLWRIMMHHFGWLETWPTPCGCHQA
jgi:hypothetical protein